MKKKQLVEQNQRQAKLITDLRDEIESLENFADGLFNALRVIQETATEAID